MKAILIPVKAFRCAKARLAPYYSQDERAALAAALCEDAFRCVGQVRGIDRVYVVSSERRALDWAHERNWMAITESEQISESASVEAASRRCVRDGVKALLRLPIDIPLATADDIQSLFTALKPAPSAVIVPSRNGTGTNALLRSPPDLFPSHFGPGSFARHLEEAERAGARITILHNERIAVDIDEPKDLRAAADRVSPETATARVLERLGLKATD
jgi:2-phospho-L-lactate guanylyltransferase